jgi:DNA-binding CsgD family transcriptional regulator
VHNCITCGAELHPERAAKYGYCMSRECQQKNAKGLTMVAVGVNKAAEQYLILDEETKQELASGRYHDQRRGSFGTSGATPPPGKAPAAATASQAPRRPGRSSRPAARTPARQPWTDKQRRLALLYNEQGLRPAEIAQKLGLSSYAVTQIILGSRTRGKV